ncbi:hypothetical protein BTVI_48139 [Pitangus sulphuratus]|nr:hypothetical protein BTVI_48139 [Pitangus sulphuratus]
MPAGFSTGFLLLVKAKPIRSDSNASVITYLRTEGCCEEAVTPWEAQDGAGSCQGPVAHGERNLDWSRFFPGIFHVITNWPENEHFGLSSEDKEEDKASLVTYNNLVPKPGIWVSWHGLLRSGRRPVQLLGSPVSGKGRDQNSGSMNHPKITIDKQKNLQDPLNFVHEDQTKTPGVGVDPATPVDQALLKTQFVAKSWVDIRKKLEKVEDWQEKGLDELLREAQKVYVRREAESDKRQTSLLVAAVRAGQKEGVRRAEKPEKERVERQAMECYYCGKKGHIKREGRKRIKDEKEFKED